MKSSTWFEKWTWDNPIVYNKGHKLEFLNTIVFFSSEDVFVFKNSVDPDEMPQYVGFHQGLHCLPKYSFRSHKGLKEMP